MTRTDHFAETRANYALAWADLNERITGGIASLNGLAEQRPSDADRLTRKANGLRAASDLYRSLDVREDEDEAWAVEGFDPAHAWRTFEASLAVLVRDENDDESRRGLLLANGYQRGYGPRVDATPLTGR